MSPLQLMELSKPKFTPNDYLIYETIIKNPALVIHTTTSVLAQKCGVSQPALSRFIKTLGYSKYQDFRADLIAFLSQKNEQDQADEGSGQLSYFNTVHRLLSETEQLLTAAYMQELSEYLRGFERIFATGVGKSYHPAELLEILSYKTRRHVHAIRRDMMTEAADFIGEDDLLIVFSVSAGIHIMNDAIETSGRIMLVTANTHHGYHDFLDRELILPYIPPDPEASAISPVLFDMFVELLIPYLLPLD